MREQAATGQEGIGRLGVAPFLAWLVPFDGPDRSLLSYPIVDRMMLLEHLEQAERHIADGERQVARQRQVVAEFTQDGHNAQAALALLAEFETTQGLHIADRDRILAGLKNLT